MPVTKHKLFSIYVSDLSKIDFDNAIMKKIDTFLIESNVVYVNHSISVLSDPTFQYEKLKAYRHFVILSIIYKDLNETEFDVSKTTKKTKEVVKKSIEAGDTVPMPNIESSFDKKLKERKKSNPGGSVEQNSVSPTGASVPNPKHKI